MVNQYSVRTKRQFIFKGLYEWRKKLSIKSSEKNSLQIKEKVKTLCNPSQRRHFHKTFKNLIYNFIFFAFVIFQYFHEFNKNIVLFLINLFLLKLENNCFKIYIRSTVETMMETFIKKVWYFLMVYKINNLSTQLLKSGLKYWQFLETWAGDLKNEENMTQVLSCC